MEELAQDVSARVAQLAADREKLAELRASMSADLKAAKESLAAKKAALSQAADTNRRNGCVLALSLAAWLALQCGADDDCCSCRWSFRPWKLTRTSEHKDCCCFCCWAGVCQRKVNNQTKTLYPSSLISGMHNEIPA